MGGMKKLTLPEMLQASFEKFSDRNSLVFAGEETRTYQNLKSEVRSCVQWESDAAQRLRF